MPSVQDLRDRIRSLKNTQQITKAMKQVAAAKIRRAETARKQARPYADALSQMLRDLMGAVSSVDHPFMKPGKPGAPAGVILMTADKGLAGAFNSNVIRAAEQYRVQTPDARFYTVGIKARNAVRRFNQNERSNQSGQSGESEATWPLSAPSKLDVAHEVAQRTSEAFVNGEISEIVLISSKLISMLSQKPEMRQLVPIQRNLPSDVSLHVIPSGAATAAQAASRPSVGFGGTSTSSASSRDRDNAAPRGSVEFAPSPEFVLSRLLPKYLEFTIFSAMLETDAAFFAAQLIAMNNATDNAGKLIDELTIQMNNARQAAITKELLEIVAGAEALAG